MKNYSMQYYFIERKNGDDTIPSLTPDKNTMDRNYSFEFAEIGSPPFIFYNGAGEYNKKLKISMIKKVPNILFSGTDILVPSKIREILLQYDIDGMYMHPSVYIHDDGKWHEDYWYVCFVERFDCWDKNKSDYEKDIPPVRLGGMEYYQIYTHVFDEKILNKIPESKRLMFKLGGSLDALIVCHESIANIFRSLNDASFKLTLIGDY